MKKLKLTLNKKWFDLIEKGIKTEEYREVKPYWYTRLVNRTIANNGTFKHFDFVEFTNGYNKTSPQITMECLEIKQTTGKVEWGAVENTQYFVIKLGREVGRQNC